MNHSTDYVLTALVGTNADLFPRILKLYARPSDKIADVTYGRGVFWKNVDVSQYQTFFTDIVDGVDMRDLPYSDGEMDMVIIDPPYIYNPKRTIKRSISHCYNINETLKLKTNQDVLSLYLAGLTEASRALRRMGFCIVKCQDTIQSSIQRWNHIEIHNMALSLGYYPKDLFVLVQEGIPTSRWKHQIHARKNHSYFWVFQKR